METSRRGAGRRDLPNAAAEHADRATQNGDRRRRTLDRSRAICNSPPCWRLGAAIPALAPRARWRTPRGLVLPGNHRGCEQNVARWPHARTTHIPVTIGWLSQLGEGHWVRVKFLGAVASGGGWSPTCEGGGRAAHLAALMMGQRLDCTPESSPCHSTRSSCGSTRSME